MALDDLKDAARGWGDRRAQASASSLASSAAIEPAAVESDLQLQEKLRFLAWVRRMEVQGRAASFASEEVPAST